MYKLLNTSLLALVTAAALSACGKQEQAAAPATTPAPAAAPAPMAGNDAGKSVYNKTCALCHAAGVAGAPKPGDKADWAPRLAQGMDTVYKHAIEGFNGAKGAMPARGGGASLTDEQVKAAVDFMVDQSK